MTGLLDGLRTWLGSFFGEGSANATEQTEEAADDPQFEGSGPTVAHRDDRPLETPDTLSPDAERPAVGGDADTPADDADGVAIPDAERGTNVERTAESGAPSDAEFEVSIPDAEARTGGSRSVTTDDDSAAASVATDADYACSVCGTPVDDPTEDCPLCHSSDVVPADGSADETPSRSGRTDVSEADDEAVDRLRDVQEDGE